MSVWTRQEHVLWLGEKKRNVGARGVREEENGDPQRDTSYYSRAAPIIKILPASVSVNSRRTI